jgi:uncharacterized membrane protein YcaP (DUF421 family)
MLHLGTPLWAIVVRTLVVYLAVLLGLRLLGKRQIGSISVADLVMILLIANAVQNAMVGTDTSLLGGLVAAAVLLIANFVVVRSVSLNPFTERLVEGTPTMLVKDGAYVDQSLHREGLARDEVDMAIREHGIGDVQGVQVAYLEPDGTVSVIPIDQKVLRGQRKVRRVRQFRRH